MGVPIIFSDTFWLTVTELTPQQLTLIQNRALLADKAHASALMVDHLKALSADLLAEVRERSPHWRVPDRFDATAFQVARGESLDGLPYQYLDVPRCFGKTSILAFRVLVWWGRSLNCSWMIQGPDLTLALDRLSGRDMAAELGVWTDADLWRWEGFTPLSQCPSDRLGAHGFLKIGTQAPLSMNNLTQDGLRSAALVAFNAGALLLGRD